MSASARVRFASLDDAEYVVRAHRLPHAVGYVYGPTSAARFAAVLEEKTWLVAVVETDDGHVGTLMATLSDPP